MGIIEYISPSAFQLCPLEQWWQVSLFLPNDWLWSLWNRVEQPDKVHIRGFRRVWLVGTTALGYFLGPAPTESPGQNSALGLTPATQDIHRQSHSSAQAGKTGRTDFQSKWLSGVDLGKPSRRLEGKVL